MTFARSAAVVSGCALLMVTSAAAAAGTTSALSWVRLPGAESCISAAELGTRVEAHLRRAVLVSPSAADVSIEGRIEPKGRAFRAVIGGTRRDGTPLGTRELTSRVDCRDLDDSLALVVALMIDPDAMTRAEVPEPPRPPPPEPAPKGIQELAVVREPHVTPDTSPATSRRWLADAFIAGSLKARHLPLVAPGLALLIRGPLRSLPLEIGFATVPSSELQLGARSVSFRWIEGSLGVTPMFALGHGVDAGFSATVKVGSVEARGEGFATDKIASTLVLDAAVGGRIKLTIAGPVFAGVGASIVVPLARQRVLATQPSGEVVVLEERTALGFEGLAGFGVQLAP